MANPLFKIAKIAGETFEKTVNWAKEARAASKSAKAEKLSVTTDVGEVLGSLHPSRVKGEADLDEKFKKLRELASENGLIEIRRGAPRSAEDAMAALGAGKKVSPQELTSIERKIGQDCLIARSGAPMAPATASAENVAQKVPGMGKKLASAAATIALGAASYYVPQYYQEHFAEKQPTEKQSIENTIRQNIDSALKQAGGSQTEQLKCLENAYVLTFSKAAQNSGNLTPNDVLAEFKSDVQVAIKENAACLAPQGKDPNITEAQLDALYTGVVETAKVMTMNR